MQMKSEQDFYATEHRVSGDVSASLLEGGDDGKYYLELSLPRFSLTAQLRSEPAEDLHNFYIALSRATTIEETPRSRPYVEEVLAWGMRATAERGRVTIHFSFGSRAAFSFEVVGEELRNLVEASRALAETMLQLQERTAAVVPSEGESIPERGLPEVKPPRRRRTGPAPLKFQLRSEPAGGRR